jgi:outer membrane protein assembly factor BamB
MTVRSLARILTFLLLPPVFTVGAFAADQPASDWPGWRGPDRKAIVQGPTWPDSLGGLTRTWENKYGPSYSGPIVSDKLVFTTATVDRKSEEVVALDRATGKEVWKASWPGAMSVPFFAAANGSWIRATPAYDGERLYVAGMRDLLVTLDAATGKEVWRIDFPAKFKTPLPDFGFVSSPLVLGEFVYVQAGGGLCKINRKTGEILWRALTDGGGTMGSAFASPVLAEIRGRKQLVVQTRSHMAGVDVESGKELWKQQVEAFRGMNIYTPVVYDNGFFASTYGAKTFFFDVTGAADQWAAKLKWENKWQGYMTTPVIIGKHAYFHLRNQRFMCVDLETGAEKWTTTQRFGKYWSLVAQGERILALDETGELLLIRANPEKFDLLDRKKVASNSWAHLAVSGNEVFIRDLNSLSRWTWSAPSTGTAPTK